MKQEVIRLENVSKSFDGEQVLKSINLSIKRNEFFTLLGPSGCGKTTMLRIIGGFETADDGNVFFDGVNINDVPPNKRNLNTVFQKYALFPHMNVYENVAFGLKIKKTPKDVIDKKVKEMLALINLKGYEKRSVTSLSGGQQQRVAIARALINEPEVLLLDEPLGALDLKLRKSMQTELKKIQQRLGITFIYVTHDQEEALTMSDRVVVMNNGIIEQIGTPEDIYNLDLKGIDCAHRKANEQEQNINFYCVGYTPVKYFMNDYEMKNLEGHKASKIGVELLATFLPPT